MVYADIIEEVIAAARAVADARGVVVCAHALQALRLALMALDAYMDRTAYECEVAR